MKWKINYKIIPDIHTYIYIQIIHVNRFTVDIKSIPTLSSKNPMGIPPKSLACWSLWPRLDSHDACPWLVNVDPQWDDW